MSAPAAAPRPTASPHWRRWPIRLLALVQGLLALVLLVGGLRLAQLNGSPYYALLGATLGISAVFLWRADPRGVGLQLFALILTVPWALWEVGLSYYGLIPRLVLPGLLTMLGLACAALLPMRSSRVTPGIRWLGAGMLFVALLATLGAAFVPHDTVSIASSAAPVRAHASTGAVANWPFYGHGPDGTRFSPATQVTPANVAGLQVAWTYRTGDEGPGEDQNVPLQVGDTLYTCSRANHVAALDADTGRVKWTFDPKAESPVWHRCRGLGYFDGATASMSPAMATPPSAVLPPSAPGTCVQRIIQTTIDARLIALDAATGKPCDGFGTNGFVDLKQGMGEVKPGFYFQTSAPLIARDRIVVGGWVRDNQARGEPSGVVRAFDVRSGALVWAWDLGREVEGSPTGDYTRGTPNMWSTASFDDALGLVYLPLGNATPDYFGAGRSAQSEKYASSVVALDVNDGRLRWNFQTVHHDIWDFDVSSQPALVDVPGPDGRTVPALLQATKRGQLFLLDRATGTPLAEVEERPTPQTGHAPGEWLSKTQPYSVGMPAIGVKPLTEARMWGVSPLDLLWCRIKFRAHRYEGDFTPPSLQGSIQFPSNYGGLNWGSTSVDPHQNYAYFNDIRLPVVVRLMPPAEAKALIAAHQGVASRHGPALQAGTPYGVTIDPMMSPLGVPCLQPPFGTMTAVDLTTRKVAWEVPMGTVEDTGPLGFKLGLPIPVGMPTIGGSVSTASGLLFFAGTQDYYLRALESATGRELWKGRLPIGSGSSPMTYVSPKTGRQYIVISAGGAPSSPDRGDYVVAYALPPSAPAAASK